MNVTITLTGTAPLLMHGNGLADPISDDAKRMKRLSGKRTKTDEDHIAMRRIEFESSLYIDPEQGPYLPGSEHREGVAAGGADTPERAEGGAGSDPGQPGQPAAVQRAA